MLDRCGSACSWSCPRQIDRIVQQAAARRHHSRKAQAQGICRILMRDVRTLLVADCNVPPCRRMRIIYERHRSCAIAKPCAVCDQQRGRKCRVGLNCCCGIKADERVPPLDGKSG